MTEQRTIRKSLAGEEDLLIGDGTVTQTRAGVSYTITKLSIVKFITNVAQLADIDTTQFLRADLYAADGTITHYRYIDPNWTIVPQSFLPAGGNAVSTSVQTKLRDFPSLKDQGAIGDGVTDDSSALTLVNALGVGIVVTAGLYRISVNTVITEPLIMLPGAKFTVDTGIILTVNKVPTAAATQELFTGAGDVVITEKVYSIHWFDTVAQAMRSASALDTMLIYKDISWSGVTVTDKLNFVGLGREYIDITGTFTLSGSGGNSTWNNLTLKTPSVSNTQIIITGVGGMNFRDCRLDPGAGNYFCDWDRDGQVPQTVEMMQTIFASGKLCKNSSAGQTHTFHVKESSLFSFTEANTLEPFAGSFITLAIYNSLVNISAAQISSTSEAQLKILAGSTIDDNTTDVAWYDNNGSGFDTLEIGSNITIAFNSATRFIDMPPALEGSGVSGDHSTEQAVSDAALITVDADLADVIRYTGTAPALLAVQSWVMKAGAGKYPGQKFKLTIHGSIPTNGNNVVVFGRTFNPASNEMQGLTVEGVFDGTWTYSYSDLI